jgi:YVTN family beta-propeller protein
MIDIKKLTAFFAFVCSSFCAAYTPNTFIAYIGGFNGPDNIAITPNGLYAYIVDDGSNSVKIINTDASSPTFNTLIPAPALLGVFNAPSGIAVSPNSQFVYVTNTGSNNIKVIDTQSNTIVATITGPFNAPNSIAITPDGMFAYVTNNNNNNVNVINLSLNTVLSTPSLNGIVSNPFDIQVTPNGNYVYVSNLSGSMTVIDTALNTSIPAPGLANTNPQPEGFAITANGLFAYVSDGSGSDVTVLNINPASPQFNTVISAPNLTNAFDFPNDVATTSDGNYAYVTNFIGATGSVSSVSVIDTNPASPTYNSTLNTPGLVVPTSQAPFTRFLALAATPDARFVYAVDGFNNTVDVIYTGIIAAPLNFSACKTRNQFLTQIDFINQLTWSAPVIGNPPAAYQIYRDATLQMLVATVSATGPLRYNDHNRPPASNDTYYIVSVDAAGNRSSAVSTNAMTLCS